MRQPPRLLLAAFVTLTVPPATALAQGSDLAGSSTEVATTEITPWVAPALSAGAALAGYGTALVAALPSGDIQPWQTGCLVGGLSLGVLGPAAGHLYTGHYGRAAAFSVGRLAMSAIALTGLHGLVEHGDTGEADYGKGETANTTLLIGGLAGVLALSIWEGFDSYRSAQARNQERPARRLALAPYLVPGAGPANVSAAGMMLAGQF
jgi:hypothetical protein